MKALLRPSGLLFKRIVLLFWTMYFSMLTLTNFVDLMDVFGVFDWTFLNSQNFAYLQDTVKVYDVPTSVTKLLLVGSFGIELIAAILFWRALIGSGQNASSRSRAMLAISFGALAWTAFIFMTEFFVAYGTEPPFRELMMTTLASGLVIVLVPDDFARSD